MPNDVEQPRRCKHGNQLFQIAQGSGGRRSCGAARQVAASLVVAAPKELPTTGTRSTRKGTFLFQYVMVASRPSKMAPKELPSPGQRSTREKKLRTPITVVASRPSKMARQEPRPPTKQNTQFQVSDCPAGASEPEDGGEPTTSAGEPQTSADEPQTSADEPQTSGEPQTSVWGQGRVSEMLRPVTMPPAHQPAKHPRALQTLHPQTDVCGSPASCAVPGGPRSIAQQPIAPQKASDGRQPVDRRGAVS
jgi:hypothetical protein